MLESGESILTKLRRHVNDAELQSLLAERRANYAEVVNTSSPGWRAIILSQEERIQAAMVSNEVTQPALDRDSATYSFARLLSRIDGRCRFQESINRGVDQLSAIACYQPLPDALELEVLEALVHIGLLLEKCDGSARLNGPHGP